MSGQMITCNTYKMCAAADFVPPVDADRYSSLLAKLNESPKDNFGVFVRQMRGVLAKAAEA